MKKLIELLLIGSFIENISLPANENRYFSWFYVIICIIVRIKQRNHFDKEDFINFLKYIRLSDFKPFEGFMR
jgi:hypothetical protein